MKRSRQYSQMEEAANRFLEEIGLTEAIEQASEMYTQNYMIQGEETEDLKEALSRAPEKLIDMIWENLFEEEPGERTDRAGREENLFTGIQEYLANELPFMEPESISLLLRIRNRMPTNYFELLLTYDELIPYGLVFSFEQNGSCTFVVMEDVAQILLTLEEPETIDQMTMVHFMRCVVRTCIKLYGACKKERVISILRKTMEEMSASDPKLEPAKQKEQLDNLEKNIRKLFPILEQKGIFWSDKNYMVSPELESRADYKRLLIRQPADYYIPDIETIRAYGVRNTVPDNIPEYRAVHKYLASALKDSGAAESILANAAYGVSTMDWGVPEIMGLLYDHGVMFRNKKTESRMANALEEWLYCIRRWSEGGYTWRERGKKNELTWKISVNTGGTEQTAFPEVSEKIYPNDPCPCGSGKKYKKCCGKMANG